MSKLRFDEQQFKIRTMEVEGEEICFRAFEDIVYVENPIDTVFQSLHVYVPEIYYEGKEINGYSLETAPVFLGNNIGGYLPSKARKPEDEMFGHTSTYFYALQHGYVVVSPGARGRTNQAEDGTYYGKAPACVVDMKAIVRYIRANAENFPGDTDKIISNGTSAGGNVSALLGVTEGSDDYLPYLKELGAAEADEHIYAVSCYCPITDLEHVDAAYEWQFRGIPDFHRMHMEMGEGGRPQFSPIDGVMTERQIELSDELADLFPEYLNSLALKNADGELLTLDPEGNGSFKDYICRHIAEANPETSGKKPESVDFEVFMRELQRMKEAPAFDDVTMENFENDLFGTEKEACSHFTEFSMQRSTHDTPRMADPDIIKMMTPFSYIDGDTKKVKHWRIRQGTKDGDISFAIPAILALTLENHGLDVDYKMVWNERHGGDYDLPELFAWIDQLCRTEGADV